MKKKNLRKGFTTTELVIVIAVIAILSAALIPTFSGLIKSASKTAALQEAHQIYNNWLLENVGSSSDLYIKSGSGNDVWYYPIVGGKLQANDATVDKPSAGPIIQASNNTLGYECVEHFSTTVSYDDTHHWEVCTTCSAKLNNAPHDWLPATEGGSNTQFCKDCDATKSATAN